MGRVGVMEDFNTSGKGNVSTAIILSKFVAAGKSVSIPFGDGCRYDLVLDDGGTLKKVQCKTGKLEDGVIRVLVSSPTRKTSDKTWSNKSYKGEVDLFAAYCPQNDKVYLIPADDVGVNSINLRVETPEKNRSDIRWAKDYEMGT
jgi:hypothetical protein